MWCRKSCTCNLKLSKHRPRLELSRAAAATRMGQGLYETIGRGPFTAKQWPKTFLASAKMCMQCASRSPTSSLTLSLSLILCHPLAKLCNKKRSFLRDTRHVAIALLLWPCCVLPAVSYFILHIILLLSLLYFLQLNFCCVFCGFCPTQTRWRNKTTYFYCTCHKRSRKTEEKAAEIMFKFLNVPHCTYICTHTHRQIVLRLDHLTT